MACPHVYGGAALVFAANPLLKSSAELQQPLDDAYLNVLSDAKFGDTNAFIGFRQPQPQWNIHGMPSCV